MRAEESQVPTGHKPSPKHMAPTTASPMGIEGTGHTPELSAPDIAERPQGHHTFLTPSTSGEFPALIWERSLRVQPWLLGCWATQGGRQKLLIVKAFRDETGGFHQPKALLHPPWGTPSQLPQPLTYPELRRDQSARPCSSPSGQTRESSVYLAW